MIKNGVLGGTWSTDAEMAEWGKGFKAAQASGYTAQFLRDHPIGSSIKDAAAAAITGGTAVGQRAVVQQVEEKMKAQAFEALSKSEQKAIRSLKDHIAEHEQKIADFKSNPTVRPGMENLPKEKIEVQQARRLEHCKHPVNTGLTCPAFFELGD
jgi:hypothetical protein